MSIGVLALAVPASAAGDEMVAIISSVLRGKKKRETFAAIGDRGVGEGPVRSQEREAGSGGDRPIENEDVAGDQPARSPRARVVAPRRASTRTGVAPIARVSRPIVAAAAGAAADRRFQESSQGGRRDRAMKDLRARAVDEREQQSADRAKDSPRRYLAQYPADRDRGPVRAESAQDPRRCGVVNRPIMSRSTSERTSRPGSAPSARPASGIIAGAPEVRAIAVP